MNATIILILGLGWLMTSIAAGIVCGKYLKAQEDIRAIAIRTAHTAATIAARATDMNLHEAVKAKISPFVEAAKDMDLSGNQKRMAVILEFLKQHPGTSVDAAERAIEDVLLESRRPTNGA